MCWSIESSRNAYIIGTIASIILLVYGDNVDKNIGVLCLTVVQMQLIEYFIWKDQSCGSMNNYASKMIVPELILQIVAMVGGSYFFHSSTLSQTEVWNLFSIVLIVAVITIGINFYVTSNETLCSQRICNTGILWEVGEMNIINGKTFASTLWNIFYFGVLILYPIFWKSDLKKYVYITIASCSLIWIHYKNRITWQSRWCYPAAFTPIIFIVIMILQQNRYIRT